jgi:hypothetical protein
VGDFIHLQHRVPPWQPSHHIETYHFHDIPLIGLIGRDGVYYLFRCLAGEVEPLNVWSYTIIEPSEIGRLKATTTADEFENVVAELTARPGVAAVAIDDLGIIGSVHVEDWSDPEPHVARLSQDVEAVISRLHTGMEAQRDRLVAST